MYKISGNYGPLLPTLNDARANGFDNVLWMLDNYVKELTTQNIFVYQFSRFGYKELVTPPLDGTILKGITRQAVKHLFDEWHDQHIEEDVRFVERDISIHEIFNSQYEGRLLEMFGSSTSHTICPVKMVAYKDRRIEIERSDMGEWFNNKLNGVKRGDSAHDWVHNLE